MDLVIYVNSCSLRELVTTLDSDRFPEQGSLDLWTATWDCYIFFVRGDTYVGVSGSQYPHVPGRSPTPGPLPDHGEMEDVEDKETEDHF